MRLVWVPGHTMIKGNEIADKLTGTEAGKSSVHSEQVVGISKNHGKEK